MKKKQVDAILVDQAKRRKKIIGLISLATFLFIIFRLSLAVYLKKMSLPIFLTRRIVHLTIKCI